jgi:hypothetical protein
MVEDVEKVLVKMKTGQFGDCSQMANIIAKHPSKSSFTTRIPHLEGQKVLDPQNGRLT